MAVTSSGLVVLWYPSRILQSTIITISLEIPGKRTLKNKDLRLDGRPAYNV